VKVSTQAVLWRETPEDALQDEIAIPVIYTGTLCDPDRSVGIFHSWVEDVVAHHAETGAPIPLTDDEAERAADHLQIDHE
jgi:hypothetical protein